MARNIIKGDELQIFLNNDYCPVYATSHSISFSSETVSIASKDNGFWGSNDVGKLNWEITAECLYTDNDFDMLFDMYISQENILIKFARVKNYDNNGLISTGGSVNRWFPDPICKQGYACITSLQATANTGENATFSITFSGNGRLKTIDNSITQHYVDIGYTEIEPDMVLFDMRSRAGINSCWMYETSDQENSMRQVELTDNKYHGRVYSSGTMFRFYLADSIIPDYMFENNTNISKATSNASTVGANAFKNSTITDITLSSKTIYYGNSAFEECVQLGRINYNDSQTKHILNARGVGSRAFFDCVYLPDTIDLGPECRHVYASAFVGCINVYNVICHEDIERLDNYAISRGNSVEISPLSVHFYGGFAPTLGTLPLGNVNMVTIYLHNSDSVNQWLESNSTWAQYADANIQLAN